MGKALKIKEERIDLRLRAEDKRLLEKAAVVQGLSVTSYVITRSLSAAHEEAIPVKTYAVSDKDCSLFMRLLEAPMPPNAALKMAGKRYKKEVAL